MFQSKVVNKGRELEEKWQQEMARKYPNQEVKLTTASGIPLKPVYGPADIKDIDFQDIGMPGVYPFTRGIYPLQYQFYPWANANLYGFGLAEDTRQRRNFMEDTGGSKGYPGMYPMSAMVWDVAGMNGFDPDHPKARGRIGQCGVSCSTLEDWKILWDGHPIDQMNMGLIVCDSSLAALAMYIVYAESRGIPPHKLRGDNLNFLDKSWYFDQLGFPSRSAFKLMTELVKYCSRNMPYWNTHCVDGYDLEEAGATPIQELAFMVAEACALADECVRAGLKPDEFLPRFSFKPAVGNDFFEEIAKIRALKRMWAKISTQRFGAQNPKSVRGRVLIQSAGSTLMAQQPLVNIVRTTLQTLASALAGVDGMQICTFDEPLWLPSEAGLQMALRIQQIILHESNIRNVSDPLGGSYYMEWLTNKIEQEATQLLAQVESMGYIRCCERGWFKNEVERSAYELRKAIDRGEKVVVGVNRYISDDILEVPPFKTDEVAQETEGRAIARVKKYKEERDNARTQEALGKLRQVAIQVNEKWPQGGDLMPALLEAARAQATLGELMGIIKEVFVYGRPGEDFAC